MNETPDTPAVDGPAPQASPVRQATPPRPLEPVVLGAARSFRPAPTAATELKAACELARKQKRGVALILRSAEDVKAVEQLMEGHDRIVATKVAEQQTQRILVRTL